MKATSRHQLPQSCASHAQTRTGTRAHFLASEMSRCLYDEKPNAALVGAIMSASRDLLTTEGQRRRMRLELLRDAQVADPAVKARDDVADIIRLAVASS